MPRRQSGSLWGLLCLLLCVFVGIQMLLLYHRLWAETWSAFSDLHAETPSHYDVLGGLPVDATDQDIKRAFRKLSKTRHPDKAQAQGRDVKAANEEFRRIIDARDVLLSPRRRDYDISMLREKKKSRKKTEFDWEAWGQNSRQQHKERKKEGGPSRPRSRSGGDHAGDDVILAKSWKGFKRLVVASAKLIDKVLGHVPSTFFIAHSSPERVALLITGTILTVIIGIIYKLQGLVR